MQHNENTMYAYVYKGQNGTDKTLIATIDNLEKPLVSNCLDEIKNMSNLAIDLAAQHNLRVKLVKYQKEQEIDFGMFFK
ncbi:hypothetical protein [Vibrio chagasii]|uniref:hypothetical protein n=1 Tax=Vibrio chagasii TaxID=170679 RepID=UPI003735F08A